MLKRFRADRAFDDFHAGQEVELNPDDATHARWIATGYLEPLDDDPGFSAESGWLDETAPTGDGLTSTTVPEAPNQPAGSDGEGAAAPAKKARRRTATTEEPAGEAAPATA